MLTTCPARASAAISGASKRSTQIRLATWRRATRVAASSYMVGRAQHGLVLAQAGGDLADRVGVEERGGPDLYRAAAGEQELHRVLARCDAADPDHGDAHGPRGPVR